VDIGSVDDLRDVLRSRATDRQTVVQTGGPRVGRRAARTVSEHTRTVSSEVQMAYDQDLANRVRELLAGEDSITEKRMFGGLAFLVDGRMTVSASRNGGLLVRIEPGETAACLKRPHVALMKMGGRTMDGWVTVGPDGLRTQRELAGWVEKSLAFAKALPAK
jgi:TfoX/Sxy family transcriptional regulator of competence genes